MAGILSSQSAEELAEKEKSAKQSINRVEQVWVQFTRVCIDTESAENLRRKREHTAKAIEERRIKAIAERDAKEKEKQRLKEAKDREREALKAAKSGKPIPTIFDIPPEQLASPMTTFECTPDANFVGLEPCVFKDCSRFCDLVTKTPGFSAASDKFAEDSRWWRKHASQNCRLFVLEFAFLQDRLFDLGFKP